MTFLAILGILFLIFVVVKLVNFLIKLYYSRTAPRRQQEKIEMVRKLLDLDTPENQESKN